ncbi:MAG: Hint domain-containing protein [Sulfitobacter sp.]
MFSAAQLTPSYGPGNATWTLAAGVTAGDLDFVSISDDDSDLERSDVFLGNETFADATITSSSNAGLAGKTIFLGDLDNINENFNGSNNDELTYPTTPSGFESSIVKIAIFNGSGSTTDPANYTQYYAFWGNEAEAAQNHLLTNGSIGTTSGNLEDGLDYSGFLACFCAGTLITTAEGQRAVEDIQPGDLVETLDHGLQPVLSCVVRSISPSKLAADPTTRPILFKPGSLGENIPIRELRVSRQHRMFIQSSLLNKTYPHGKVLIPAIKLLPQAGVQIDRSKTTIRYYHLWLNKHEILFAEGTATESLYVPDGAQNPLAHFPGVNQHKASARPILEDKVTVRRLINQTRRQCGRLVTVKEPPAKHIPNAFPDCEHLQYAG